MKNVMRIFVVAILLVGATTGFGFGQGMVYQTHQEMTLASATGLMETWTQLPNDNYVRVTTDGSSVTVESTAGWNITWVNVGLPCVTQYDGTIWCAMNQNGVTTIGGTTHPAPPAGDSYAILVKISSAGSILGSWQAIGTFNLSNIAILNNTEIALVGSAGTALEHLTSPNGGGVVLIHNGTDWDTTKGFFIERPSGGSSPRVLSAQYLPNGNLALAGYTYGGNVSFGGISLPAHGGTDGFRGEITSTGTGISAVQMAGNGTDEHELQITKADGSFMVTGTYSQPITFYNADGTSGGSLSQHPAGASHDHVYFAYYNASGVFQSASVAYNNVATTDLNNVDLVYGNDSFYAMVGNDGGVVTTPTGSHSKVAPIILKFDNTGTSVWSKQFDGVGSGNPAQYGEEILVSADTITLTGTEFGTCDLDFNSGVVSISSTSYWCEYFDGIVVGPTADFSGSPTSIEEGQSVTFTDASMQGTSPIINWTWTFEGGTPGTFSGQNPPAIVYNVAGTYDVTLVVSDGSLSDTMLKTDYITVNPPIPPTADFSGSPTSIDEGGWVSFVDASTEGTNPITTWTWTFEGGTPGTFSGQNPPAIVYNVAGTYDVTLVVSDGSLSDTMLKTDYITVNPPPPYLTIYPWEVTVSAASGNTSFSITSNESWSIVTSDPDVIATPSSGTGDETINVSYPAINTMAGETYTVTVTSGSGIVEIFTITQNGVSAFITLTPDQANVPANSGSLTFDLDCPEDLSWTGTDGNFSSPSPNSGTGAQTVTLSYEENTSPDSRVDVLTFSGSGVSADFTLTQVGAGAPLEALASSDKPVYTTGQTAQLFGSATGGTGSYSYEWTGTGGFSSSEQNPTVELLNEGHYVFTLIVDDGENTATDQVEVDVYDVWLTLEIEPWGGTTDDTIHHVMEIHQRENDPRTVTYNSASSDFYLEEGAGNILEWDYQYPEGVYDIEGYYELSDGSSADTTWLGIIDIILGQEEISVSNINIYPNPTSGNMFINAQERLERVSIMNISGREVFHQENLGEMTQLNLSSLSPGLYFVRIYSGGVLITKKVVKE